MFTSLRFLPPDRQREALRSRGFTPEQIEILLAYRAAYETGQFAYDAPADYHLAFARWLYLHGKISS